MKKIFLSFIAICAMFFGVIRAEAYELSYTSYKAGDEIEVILGKGIKEKFYVIKDSDSENDMITAIYKDVLGEEISFGLAENSTTFSNSEARKKLDELVKMWSEPESIRLLMANEINSDYKKGDYEFENPSYLNIGKSYWTETVQVNDGKYVPYLIKSSTNKSILKASEESLGEKGYLRPVITIYKSNVTGGVSIPKNWNEFAEGYIKWNVDHNNNYFERKNMVITTTDDMIHIKYIYDDKEYEVKINYENGIVKSKTVDDKLSILDNFDIYLQEFIYGIIGYDGYSYIEEYKVMTLKSNKYLFSENVLEDSMIIEADLAYYLGWKKEEPKVEETKKEEPKKEEIKEEVKNPKTADTNVILVTLGLIASGSLIVISKKKLCKNK